MKKGRPTHFSTDTFLFVKTACGLKNAHVDIVVPGWNRKRKVTCKNCLRVMKAKMGTLASTEEKRLIDLLWKMRRTHIENRMSSYGKVLAYINEAIGKERFDQAMKDIDQDIKKN